MIKKLLRKISIKFNSPVLAHLDRLEYIKQIERAYKAGYNYHQKIINSDPEMRKWITQEHY
jgi:hypothetical protein